MPEAQDQFVKFYEDGPITVGTVYNSTMLDGVVVTQFGEQVLQYVQEQGRINLLLDFTNVEYLSSAALTELIRISDAVVSNGGALRLCGLSPQIQKVFEITKFDKSFDIQRNENVHHALTRFKRSIAIEEEEDAWDERRGG